MQEKSYFRKINRMVFCEICFFIFHFFHFKNEKKIFIIPTRYGFAQQIKEFFQNNDITIFLFALLKTNDFL